MTGRTRDTYTNQHSEQGTPLLARVAPPLRHALKPGLAFRFVQGLRTALSSRTNGVEVRALSRAAGLPDTQCARVPLPARASRVPSHKAEPAEQLHPSSPLSYRRPESTRRSSCNPPRQQSVPIR